MGWKTSSSWGPPPAVDLDIKVKVSSDDTTEDFLLPKLVAGTNITLTEQNPGGNENIKIDAAVALDVKASVSGADTTPNFLDPKITIAAGSGLSKAITSPGGDEKLELDFGAAGLTALYPFSQKFIPASEMELVGPQSPIRQSIVIGARNKTYEVITFASLVLQRASWIWSFKSGKMDVSAPAFRYIPIWFQDADAVNPAEVVRWEVTAMNALVGTTLDAAFAAASVSFDSPTQDEYKMAGVSGDASQEITGANLTGDALSATLENNLQFNIARIGSDGGDTFGNPAHLVGMMLQYKNDFANISQWSVIIPP